jgi:hypothetical protein
MSAIDGACATCGNVYDKAFTVESTSGRYTFDCFECAIHALAPLCTHCGIRTIGHGVEANGRVFCCAHCARSDGAAGIVDRTDRKPRS